MIIYELERVWKKKSYLCMLCIMIILQIFLLWYGSIYKNEGVALEEYKKINDCIMDLTEEEKGDYLINLRDSWEGDTQWIDQLYGEYEKVNNYEAYIEDVTKRPEKIGQISIFSEKKSDAFSEKCIIKSAKAHMEMGKTKPKFIVSKGIEETLKFDFKDIFLMILTVFLAAVITWEEKETNLWIVLRATNKGRLSYIISKLFALILNISIISGAQLFINYIWYGINAGFTDLTLPIQSVASYMESNLQCSIMVVMILVWIGKIIAAAITGIITMVIANRTKTDWVVWICSILAIVFGIGIYYIIPLHSKYEVIKYASLGGIMNMQTLCGNYANLNLFKAPVNVRTFCVLFNVVLAILLFAINIIVFLFFYNGNIVEKKKGIFRKNLLENTPLSHEIYKIFVMNKAVYVVILFVIISGIIQYNTEYKMPAKEIYYRDFMLELEGNPNSSKDELIEKEQRKYDQAFLEIERIDTLMADGKIDTASGETMKNEYQMIVSYYPQFKKILHKYEIAKKENLSLLYDTGYKELFWQRNNCDNLLIELLLAAIAIILGFSKVMSMENERNTWMLLQTTYIGRKKIIRTKLILCSVTAIFMGVIGYSLRIRMLNKIYPIRKILYPLATVFENSGCGMSLIGLIVAQMIIHALIYMIIMLILQLISYKRQSTIEVYVLGVIIILIPLLLILAL